jgi:putative lysine transport system substrate-binding protein
MKMKKFAFLLVLFMIFSVMVAMMFFSGQDKKQAENVLRVGMECAYAPYNWTQPTEANGAVLIAGSKEYAYGYDVMMAKYLADKIGYRLEIHKMDWDSLPIAVQSGTVDCVIAGQSITEDRKMTVDFTSPYYYASIVCIVKNESTFAAAGGISDLNGAVGTSQLNTVWYDVCLPQIKGATILPAMESAPAMLVALISGKCDLVVTDMPTAMAAVAVYPELKLLDFTDSPDGFLVSEQEINIGISLKKGNTDLLNKLNDALEGLTTADFERMMNEAIKVQPLSVE